MFAKILIANRGEIACRIIRTCRQLGIRTVAVYSDADASAQHVRQADEAVHIGGSRPGESYLLGNRILEAAHQTGAKAIHPGYGFLSENVDFAEAVEQAGLVFIGPSAASMRKMGSKAGAKILMQSHGVPVVPGYTGEDQTPSVLQQEADRIGYPLMIKAAHGGGGKGMRIVRDHGEFLSNLESCQREAKNAFGRDRVLLERYVETPRHIEFQVFADSHGNTIHLDERECSAQRRYQKVWEETPSPFLTTELRQRMGEAAVAAAKAIDYCNAGTVEFIVGPQGDFYFMEINTRLQVEHPVTELTHGIDLVEWQLRIAAGESLPMSQAEVQSNGHAIEVRLYAEDPEKNFLPGSGQLIALQLPASSTNIRIDSGVVQGDTVTIFYDPMIAKLIAFDQDRARAITRLREALAQCEVIGPRSNIEFLEQLAQHRSIVNGTIDTGYLDRHLEEFLPSADHAPSSEMIAAAACMALLREEACALQSAKASGDPHSPWAIADAWRLAHRGSRKVSLLWREQRFDLVAHGHVGDYELAIGDQLINMRGARVTADRFSAQCNSRGLNLGAMETRTPAASGITIHTGTRRYRFAVVDAFAHRTVGVSVSNRVQSPMPGRIVAVKNKAGDVVKEGQELIVMEAMKMEITLRAPFDGLIERVTVEVGAFVEADVQLITFVTPKD